MRTLGLILFLAACSSNNMDSEVPISVVSMTCSTAVTDYCTSNTCNTSFAAALQDTHLCPASQMTCGEFNVILKGSADGSTNFFYSSGQLVAIAHAGLSTGSGMTCLAGPAAFSGPQCATTGRPLPACASGEPMTGW